MIRVVELRPGSLSGMGSEASSLAWQQQYRTRHPDEGDEEPQICLCEDVASEVALLGQNAFSLVEALKHLPAAVCCLGFSRSEPVHRQAFAPQQNEGTHVTAAV